MQKETGAHAAGSLNVFSHPRLSELGRLVYPVFSRRSGGLSIGINLNPDRKCSFGCVYCQVDRNLPTPKVELSVDRIEKELEDWLRLLSTNGWTYENRPLKDISIAGDGEPTCVGELPQVLKLVAEMKARYECDSYKLVLFTNGSKMDRSDLVEPLARFYGQGGEIWFKLDFWDRASLRSINRTRLSDKRLIGNLIVTGRRHPLVIQSCLFRWEREKCDPRKYQPYVDQLRRILAEGTRIKLLQLYTLARTPEDRTARSWTNGEMDRLGSFIGSQIGIETKVYYGSMAQR